MPVGMAVTMSRLLLLFPLSMRVVVLMHRVVFMHVVVLMIVVRVLVIMSVLVIMVMTMVVVRIAVVVMVMVRGSVSQFHRGSRGVRRAGAAREPHQSHRRAEAVVDVYDRHASGAAR